jgi:mannose/fructose/N-acetylgalactosamine-specific phosphotransferase system component IID
MARLTGRALALWRLLGIQATWNYERLQGIGLARALEPLLGGAFGRGSPRYREALARAAGFFNANPYLAAAAVGAEIRAEVDGVPGAQIDRLRTALSGPLGALGDRLFWTGLVPGLASAAIIFVVLGGGWWAIAALVVVHNLVRAGLGIWLLDLGWRHGVRVGAAINGSALPRVIAVVGRAATVTEAMVLPVVAVWLLGGAPRGESLTAMALAGGMIALRRLVGGRASALPLTLLTLLGLGLWYWGTA